MSPQLSGDLAAFCPSRCRYSCETNLTIYLASKLHRRLVRQNVVVIHREGNQSIVILDTWLLFLAIRVLTPTNHTPLSRAQDMPGRSKSQRYSHASSLSLAMFHLLTAMPGSLSSRAPGENYRRSSLPCRPPRFLPSPPPHCHFLSEHLRASGDPPTVGRRVT